VTAIDAAFRRLRASGERGLVVYLTAGDPTPAASLRYLRAAEDAGADGLELNFGCPHGMSERGMGAAVGQVPEYSCQITEWAKETARTPVMVKLTPNVTDIRAIGRAAKRGGADALTAHCLDRLAAFKVPSVIHILDEVPRTATGKLQKFKLREKYWGGAARKVN